MRGQSRDEFLARACAGDAQLRCEIDQLLQHDPGDDATTALDRCGMGRELLASDLAREYEAEPRDATPDPAFVGRYKIRRRIAEGGMGVVYLAEQDQPRRQVALKVIRSGIFTQELLRRFEFEAELLGRLQHPGIAGIYDAGEAETDAGRRPYFAMEYVEGVPLTEHADRRGLGLHERLVLLARICDAVHHAHQHGIVHRDLKPGNILVVDEQVPERATPAADGAGPVGQPKVLDFGVSRLIRERPADALRLTRTGYVVGTVAYMSPEQASGAKSVDTRSDVYSLGVIAFELLSGRLPHDCADLPFVSALRLVQETAAPRLESVCAECRGDVSVIVGKALAAEPEHRYASAAAFADDIRRYLAHLPIAARPPTLGYQLNRFVRRNKAVVCGATIAVLSLVVGLAVAIRAQRDEAKQRIVAERKTEEAQRAAYAALVQLAAGYGASGDADAARRRLEGTPPELRGWEHEYLVRGLEDELSHVRLDIAASPRPALTSDHAFVVFAAGERTLRAADLVSGEWTEHELPYACSRGLAVLDDRRTVIAADAEHGVFGIDLAREREPVLLFASSASIWLLAVDRSGRRAVVASGSRSNREAPSAVSIVDVDTGCVAAQFAGLPVASVADVSPDGASIVFGSLTGRMRMYDVASGKTRYELDGYGHAVTRICFAPSGARFVSTDPAFGTRVWNAEDGRLIRILDTAQSAATALRFDPDDDTLISGHENGRVRRWNVVTGECEWMTSGRERPTAASRRVLELASPRGDGLVHVIDCDGITVRPTRVPLPEVLRHDDGVWPFAYDVEFSRDGRLLVSCGWDGAVRIWDVATRRPVTVLDCAPSAHYARYSPDGERLLVDVGVGYSTHRIELWDARRMRRLATLDAASRVVPGAFLPDGDTIVLGRGTELVLADARTLDVRKTVAVSAEIWSLAASPDGARVACGLVDGTVLLLDTNTWQTRHRVDGHEQYVGAVTFSPDGRRLASGGSDATLNVWDVATGRREFQIVSPECIEILVLRFTADGRRLLVGSRHPAILVRDAATGRELLSLERHTDYVHGLAFTPDDRILASASGDNTVRIWDARSLVEKIAERDRMLAAENAVRERVERLLAELGSVEAVLVEIGDDPAARNVVLRMRP